MKITITGRPKEIAAFAVETQRRQIEVAIELRADRETEAHKAGKIESYGPTSEKLGYPANSDHKIERHLRSTGLTSEYSDSNCEGPIEL